MIIYEVTEDLKLVEHNYDNVANLEAFEREMDELFEVWFNNPQDAHTHIIDSLSSEHYELSPFLLLTNRS